MSARTATTGPGLLPTSRAVTPYLPTPVLMSVRPSARRRSATTREVLSSRLESSGCMWKSRRCATSCGRIASASRAILWSRGSAAAAADLIEDCPRGASVTDASNSAATRKGMKRFKDFLRCLVEGDSSQGNSNKDGQDRQDRKFLLSDFRFSIHGAEPQIGNQKPEIENPVHPVHPCSFSVATALARVLALRPAVERQAEPEFPEDGEEDERRDDGDELRAGHFLDDDVHVARQAERERDERRDEHLRGEAVEVLG